LKKKYFNFLFECSETELIGVRIPDNDFTREIQESGVPFITTSVNVSGEASITKISELPEKLIERVDHIVDVGPLNGKPSTLVLNGKEISR
jgi:tRNA A37 threonylcarbamoyladenosine synthetase subunit TsaC/SUA5/YrdC